VLLQLWVTLVQHAAHQANGAVHLVMPKQQDRRSSDQYWCDIRACKAWYDAMQGLLLRVAGALPSKLEGGRALQVKALPCASALFPFGLPQKQDD